MNRRVPFVSHKKSFIACKLRTAPSGVTLLELLVALSLTGIFSLALYGFLFLHRNVLAAEEIRISVRENSRLALDFITRELRQAGARPVSSGPCVSFQRLTAAQAQRVTMQYDFRSDRSGRPPDGCPDDPSERVVYMYSEDSQAILRATGRRGRPQPFINDVPPDGFLLRYFDRNRSQLTPPLDASERAAVHAIEVTVRTSRSHPNPLSVEPISTELRSLVFLPNPPS